MADMTIRGSSRIENALEPAAPAIIAAAANQQYHDDDQQKCGGVHSDLLAVVVQAGGTLGTPDQAPVQRMDCLMQSASAIPV